MSDPIQDSDSRNPATSDAVAPRYLNQPPPMTAHHWIHWAHHATRTARLQAAVIGLIACGVIGIALWLNPASTGVGTHRQLGLPACGMLQTTGLPCPTCGMTTSFTEMVHGHPWRSVMAQPTGALMCLGVLLAIPIAALCAVCGTYPVVAWHRIPLGWLAFTIGAIFFAGWGFKIIIGLLNGTLPYMPPAFAP